MKRIVFVMAAMLCLFCNVATAQPVKQKVAVYVTGDADAGYKKVVGSKLVTGITRSENYAAVERTADFLAEMAKEQDYQMSGAVSDNQIARLGQQFGVRYVVVADISEVFEAMFVSARMIDVQTGQITAATEASGSVNSIDGLTKLAENVVLEIVGVPVYAEDAVKLQGPYSAVKALRDCGAPEGYHIASKEEVEGIIKNYQLTGKKLSFPIYADIQKGEIQYSMQYFSVSYYQRDSKGRREFKTYNASRAIKYLYPLTCTIIEETGKTQILDLTYVTDDDYASDRNRYMTVGENVSLDGLSNKRHIPHMVPGYVYVIKNKENK